MEHVKGSYEATAWVDNHSYADLPPIIRHIYDLYLYRKMNKTFSHEHMYRLHTYHFQTSKNFHYALKNCIKEVSQWRRQQEVKKDTKVNNILTQEELNIILPKPNMLLEDEEEKQRKLKLSKELQRKMDAPNPYGENNPCLIPVEEWIKHPIYKEYTVNQYEQIVHVRIYEKLYGYYAAFVYHEDRVKYGIEMPGLMFSNFLGANHVTGSLLDAIDTAVIREQNNSAKWKKYREDYARRQAGKRLRQQLEQSVEPKTPKQPKQPNVDISNVRKAMGLDNPNNNRRFIDDGGDIF